MEELKLYVWDHEVLCDHSCGIIAALATSVDEARRVALRDCVSWERKEIEIAIADEPTVYNTPHAVHAWGGG